MAFIRCGFGLAIFVTLGCGGSGGTPPIPPVAPLVASAHCGAITSLDFGATQVGQTASAFVQFTNTGADVADGLALVLDGPDAGEFSVDAGCPDGGALGPDALCIAQVQLVGTSVGAKSATLHYGGHAIALGANVAATPDGLFVRTANLDFLQGSIGNGPQPVIVSNQGATAIALPPIANVVTDGLLMNATNDCPASLLPGAACTITPAFAQLDAGCVAGTLHVGTIDLPITSEYIAIPGIMVSSFGDAHGRVTSDAGMDCAFDRDVIRDGSVCAHRVEGDSITYTAVPDAGSHFTGWNAPGCGMATTCKVPIGPHYGVGSITASFAPPEAHALHITIAGEGLGDVSGCRTSCTQYVQDGASGMLTAKAFSKFDGWSGACAGTGGCDLGLIVNDRDVTATFSRDAHETGTIAPYFSPFQPFDTNIAAYLPGGDLIVIDSNTQPATGPLVSRVTPTGDVVWSRYLAGDYTTVTTATAGGAIYVTAGAYTTHTLYQLAADGTPRWSVASALVGAATTVAAVGEDVAIGGATGIEVRSAIDGAVRWSASTDSPVTSIAAGPGGIVAITVGSEIRRFANDGTPMLPAWTATGLLTPQLAYDGAGNLAALGEGAIQLDTVVTAAKLVRFSPTGGVDFAVDLDLTNNTGGGRIVATSAGKLAVVRMHHGYQVIVGAYVELYDATGTRVWQVEKWGTRSGPGAAISGFAGGTPFADTAGNFIVVGLLANPWQLAIESFAP